MKIAMAKVSMKSLDFEDTWKRWMSEKDRRFQSDCNSFDFITYLVFLA